MSECEQVGASSSGCKKGKSKERRKRVGSRAGLKTGGGDYKFADTRYSSYQIH